jgi:dienelactone hydrolase
MTLLLLALVANLYQPVADPQSPAGIDYQRYFTRDSYGRQITFYVDKLAPSNQRLPIATFILGSGANSRFLRRDGKLLSADATFLRNLAGRARLVLVEKPGLTFTQQSAVKDAPAFREQHTLPRWVEAISAALRAARKLPGVDTSRLLVVGHSEGAQVASSVAAANPFVTHVACLAGASATQLFSELRDRHSDPQSLAAFWQEWRAISAAPNSADRLFHGHAYRYWSTFLATSALEDLPRSRASIFIAQGSLDGPHAITDLDLVFATLASKGRDITRALINGADHGFSFPADPTRDGWSQIQQRVLAWFFDNASCSPTSTTPGCRSSLELTTRIP